MNRPMELEVWKGDWGLASIDLECLRLVTLCKFAGAPVTVKTKNHTLNTPNGRLPVFRHYNHTISTFEGVLSYLTNKNLSPDFGLTEKQKADAIAFTMYLKEFLYPAILYVWWMDERNRINLTRKWWSKTLPFPLSFFMPDRYHRAAQNAVEALFPHIECELELEKEIFNQAEQCLTSISHRLGSQEFMFGNHPTSVDATLYGYLAPLVKAPFPNSKLKNQVLSYNNLLKYVTRISQRYFAAETKAYEAQRQQETAQQSGQTDNFPHRRRNQVFAAVFALAAMAGYAISIGMLQIPPTWFSHKSSRVIEIPVHYYYD